MIKEKDGLGNVLALGKFRMKLCNIQEKKREKKNNANSISEDFHFLKRDAYTIINVDKFGKSYQTQIIFS